YKAVKAAQEAMTSDRALHDTLSVRNSRAASIPDNDPRGIFSPVTISQRGTLQDIKVYIQAEHEFLSDLSFSLISPQGIKILVQGRTLGRQTRLQRTYSFVSTPALRRLLTVEVNGRWQLQVIDHAPGSVGTLKKWELILGV
ncbi:MAG: proprotein convertase P-domain-containing protein, partial [Cyanobacteria bacterium J06555_13]